MDHQKQDFFPTSRLEVNVAFIGQKGIPATFGGIEAHVDELSRGLARRGHLVSVYVRNWYTPRRQKSYQGVKLFHVPTIRTKHLDAAVHSFLSSLHCLFTGAEIIHYHGIGPAIFSFIPRFAGRKVVATVHRLDWASEKWGRTARLLLKIGERACVSFPHRTITVSQDLRQAIFSRDGRETIVIPNGIDPLPPRPLSTAAAKYGLSQKRYLLFMGRLVPEKEARLDHPGFYRDPAARRDTGGLQARHRRRFERNGGICADLKQCGQRRPADYSPRLCPRRRERGAPEPCPGVCFPFPA